METIEQLRLKRQELIDEKNENLEILASIKSQIERAKTDVLLDDVYSDPDWFRRINAAKRFKGRKDQELASELRKIDEKIKELNRSTDLTREEKFIRVAKNMLIEEVYFSIWKEVDRS